MILTITKDNGDTNHVEVTDFHDAAEAISEASGYDSDDIIAELEESGSFDGDDAEYVVSEGTEGEAELDPESAVG